jgi:ribosomal protein L27
MRRASSSALLGTCSAMMPTPDVAVQARYASKASGGATKYQARPSHPGPYLFHFEPNGGLVKGGMAIKDQKWRYSKAYDREPEYHAGRNVSMNQRKYTLYSKTDGVMTIRKSRSNPAWKWIDIEPDIAKVKHTRALRSELRARSNASFMVEGNEKYTDELEDLNDPDWRLRDNTPTAILDRFPDPNRLTRGVSWSARPKPKYTATK